MKYALIFSLVWPCLASAATGYGGESAAVLVEAESFDEHGGWKLDTQFIEEMGSPYLLAHGLGQPVKDATTKVSLPTAGTWQVYVRTKDWVARWKAEGTPGRFQLLINGKPLEPTFGTTGTDWHWQDGGKITLEKDTKSDTIEISLTLHDLTGFDGRCDAICFVPVDSSTETVATPPNEAKILPQWRREMLGLPEEPQIKDGYDLVVIGGGYAGVASALSASRMGLKVALVQNRPVLGGNGSSEVRVWAMGNIRRGKYPRIGEIVEEFCDHAKKSPGTYEEFGDMKKEEIVRAEKNIDLFLNHHAYKVETDPPRVLGSSQAVPNQPDAKITGVSAFDTRTSERKTFRGKLFVDCTGHGTIGFLAGADWDMTSTGRMGMSNMWAWGEGEKAVEFPKTPWALDLTMRDFPYPRDHHGQWFWESGFDKDPLGDAEGIRDWNLRAVYGAFNAMKNRDGAAKHRTAFLTWIAYIGGPRESRRLMGDVVLESKDITEKRDFKDGCVPSTWSIDLHYPKKQYAEKFPENPFISIAEHDRRIDRNYGYPVPYRCFYSRNIGNLFMAGRCISVTHEALGTTRVMKTCGMMGEVVGKAAWVCVTEDVSPRGVYEKHWPLMDKLLQLPGKARRNGLTGDVEIPKDALPLAGAQGPPTGLDPAKLEGVIVDDRQAKKSKGWTEGTGLKGYVGYAYSYAGPSSKATASFSIRPKTAGRYELRFAYLPHENRGSKVPITVRSKSGVKQHTVDMRKAAPREDGFLPLGEYTLAAGEEVSVSVSTTGAGGNVHIDAVQLAPVK